MLFRIQVKEGKLPSGSRISLALPGSWTWHTIRPTRREDGKLGPTLRVPSQELMEYFALLPTGRADRWRLEVLEEHHDGTYHRFDRRLVLTCLAGELGAGQEITLQYGSAARPIRTSRLAETVPIPVRFDLGDGQWRKLRNPPRLTTFAGAFHTILVTADSVGTVGQPVDVHVTARDRLGNSAELPSGLELRSSDPGMEPLSLNAEGAVWKGQARFTTPGFQTLEVGNGAAGLHRSNPIRVTEEEAPLKLYWGDLHSHSTMSKDALGVDPFTFARDQANLDFFASSEHSSGDRRDEGITDSEWRAIQASVRSFYDPGRFVTLLGYECSLPAPFGHHNVYFADDEAPLYRKLEVKTLEELWRRLSSHRAFTVPHHTGVHWAAAVWDRDHSLRPLFEIFSVHGQSELFEPEHPLSYDQLVGMAPYGTYPIGSELVPEEHRGMVPISNSAQGPHYARDAWAAGLKLGTIAASDDHTARPGQPYWGLAAVWAERLDRETIFQALAKRQTYATTGQRIYLDFRINGGMPGTMVTTGGPPRIELEVHGTDDIAWVELAAFVRRREAYSLVKRWTPRGSRLRESLTDEGYSDRAFYYVRVRQRGLVEHRAVMAWSSPIWIESGP
ncbi:MAG: DUF3604 domain-containing protein [Candidatus Aminicenantes bacterium]|nr:DUF3604 domain-containing protein [Candidatus Aminicenantes bacterium]